jgi:uridine kinase
MKSFTTTKGLSDYIIKTSEAFSPYVIAVDGFGGSGKSTLCNHLSKLLTDSMIIQTDDFIKSPHEPNVFEHDWQAIEDKVLKRIKTDNAITVKIYDWHILGAIPDVKAAIKRYVLIDGIGLLESKFTQYFDLKIWMDCPYELALERGKKRDKEEQGVDHDELWDTIWGPGSQDYFKRARPDLRADVLFKQS